MTDSTKDPIPLWPLLEPAAKGWFDEQRDNAAETGGGLPSIAGVSACSTAISAKRQADALEAIAKHLAPVITASPPFDIDDHEDRIRARGAAEARAVDDGFGPVAISKYVMSRVEMLALDFNWWSDKAKHELIQIAIAAVREWDKVDADRRRAVDPPPIPFKDMGEIFARNHPDAVRTVRKDGDLFWFNRDDFLALRGVELCQPIEVRYRPGGTTPRPLEDRMCLGDAIEWSLLMRHSDTSVHRTLKASIAEWRPL